jgi:hypothetical protein
MRHFLRYEIRRRADLLIWYFFGRTKKDVHNWKPWPGIPGQQFCPDCPAMKKDVNIQGPVACA